MLVGAAMVAITIPAMGFAARDAFTGSGTGIGFGHMKMFGGSGSEMPGRGMHKGLEKMGGGMGAQFLTNDKVREALAASGVTLPSVDEINAFETKMKAAREAQAKLSDADKAELKKMREATMEQVRKIHLDAAKTERDFLRSKGVALPTEDEIAKMREVGEKAAETFRSTMQGKFGKDGEGRGMMGRGHGPRGGFDRDGDDDQQEPAPTGSGNAQ